MLNKYNKLNALYYAWDIKEFNIIFIDETTIEQWNTLVTTYEATSQVRESKISIYIYQYEVFKMLLNGRVKGMYIRFTDVHQ